MGKATIASGGTEGLYTVDLDYGSEIITAQVANIDAQISDRQADLTEAETAANDAQTALNAATNDVDNAITAYTADPTDANRLAMNAAATEAARLAAEYRNAEARRQSLAAIVLSLQADKSQLQDVRTSETRQAWCVDYTEDATGEVATIEIPGEIGNLVITPGGRAPTAADGRLIARGAQVSYQAYYNAAILPGWQRFVHPYRVGELTAKDGDTGTVNLDGATSSANGLQVRDPETITAPIVYMTCNGAVFEVGDRVVVDTSGPTIIGFESNPKKCENKIVVVVRVAGQPSEGRFFEPGTSTDTSCDAGQGSTDQWAAVLTLEILEMLGVFRFDPEALNYEGDGLGNITDQPLDPVLQTIATDNTHIISGYKATDPVLSGTLTVSGVTLYSAFSMEHTNNAWSKLIQPIPGGPWEVCVIPDSSANAQTLSSNISGLPNVEFQGSTYIPIGIVRSVRNNAWIHDLRVVYDLA